MLSRAYHGYCIILRNVPLYLVSLGHNNCHGPPNTSTLKLTPGIVTVKYRSICTKKSDFFYFMCWMKDRWFNLKSVSQSSCAYDKKQCYSSHAWHAT